MKELVGDLRRTRLCCSGSERRRICTPKWGHSAFSFWFWVVGDHPSALISQSRQSKQSWHVEQSLHATAPPHAPDDPDTPTRHAQWEAIAHDRASRRKHLAAQMGGRQNPTHTGAAQTPYTSALARCGRRSPLSYRLFNGGVRPRAAPSRSRRETSEPHAMRACAMAPLAPCLRQID